MLAWLIYVSIVLIHLKLYPSDRPCVSSRQNKHLGKLSCPSFIDLQVTAVDTSWWLIDDLLTKWTQQEPLNYRWDCALVRHQTRIEIKDVYHIFHVSMPNTKQRILNQLIWREIHGWLRPIKRLLLSPVTHELQLDYTWPPYWLKATEKENIRCPYIAIHLCDFSFCYTESVIDIWLNHEPLTCA